MKAGVVIGSENSPDDDEANIPDDEGDYNISSLASVVKNGDIRGNRMGMTIMPSPAQISSSSTSTPFQVVE